jgi:hypothetical protein
MIPLDKNYPNINPAENFRPIIVVSNVIKYLEGFIMKRLSEYGKNNLDKSQFGFIKKVGI